MSEQNPETQYDPTAHTVDEVNDYLDENPDQAATVLQAEADRADGKDARVGITEGRHQATEDTQDEAVEADQPQGDTLLATTSTDASTGVVGHTAGPDDEFAVQPADQSAPPNVSTDPADGFVVTPDSPEGTAEAATDDRPATMSEQSAPTLEGEAYQKGYLGTLPDEGNRPDLTLAGVLKSAQAQSDQG